MIEVVPFLSFERVLEFGQNQGIGLVDCRVLGFLLVSPFTLISVA